MIWKKWKFRFSTMYYRSNKHIELVIGSSNLIRIASRKNTTQVGRIHHPRSALQFTIMILGHTVEFQIEYINFNAPKGE